MLQIVWKENPLKLTRYYRNDRMIKSRGFGSSFGTIWFRERIQLIEWFWEILNKLVHLLFALLPYRWILNGRGQIAELFFEFFHADFQIINVFLGVIGIDYVFEFSHECLQRTQRCGFFRRYRSSQNKARDYNEQR